MISEALSLLAFAFDGVYSWFVALFNSMGGIGYVFGVLFAMFAIRYIINPFLQGGVGASDPVSNREARRARLSKER